MLAMSVVDQIADQIHVGQEERGSIQEAMNRASKPKPFSIPGEVIEGRRNVMMFAYACRLQAKGMDDAEIKLLTKEKNREVCSPPLSDDEVASICKSAIEHYKKGKGSNFDHASFGDELIYNDHMVFIDGAPAVWNGSYYETGATAVYTLMTKRKYGITDRQRRETMGYLELRAPKKTMADSRYIAFTNGVLDIMTGELMPASPDLVIPNLIPHKWNPDAKSDVLDKALDQWACGRADVRQNLDEVLGLSLYRGRDIVSCPLLIGIGSNGKSTFLNLIHGVLGEDNVSSLDISNIGERFQSTALVGKLANFGDDISNEFVNGSKLSVVKKAITGDWVSAEYKGGATFSFRPYCLLVFSCNEMPRLGDTSDGFFRRIVPIPFDARFRTGEEGCNHHLGEDLSSEEVYEHAITIAVRALKRCIEQGCMTQSASQDEMLDEIKQQNSPVYQFSCDELDFGQEAAREIVGETTGSLYLDYKRYCEESECKPVGRTKFTAEMNRIYGTKSKREYVETALGRSQLHVFCKKEF